MAQFWVAILWLLVSVVRGDLPPGLALAWSAHVSCEVYFQEDWYLDLTTATGPRYRQVTMLPAMLLNKVKGARMYTEDSVGVDVQDPSHVEVTYDEGGDAVCGRTKAPFSLSIPFVTSVRDPTVQWKDAGPAVVGGRNCTMWQANGTIVCVAADGSPLEIAYLQSNQACLFSNVTLGHPDESVFARSFACKTYPTPACKSTDVVNLTVYRLSSGDEPLELDNRDTGDLPATPSILCDFPESATSRVTAWAVTARASWGQYGRCHYNGTNYCDAQTGNEVGRQLPQGIGTIAEVGLLQGQCSPNEASGSWISFPASGKCGPGKAVGDGGCTWIARPARTINASCIVANPAFRAACTAELGHGYSNPKTASIVAAAFASDDPFKGGCPEAAWFATAGGGGSVVADVVATSSASASAAATPVAARQEIAVLV